MKILTVVMGVIALASGIIAVVVWAATAGKPAQAAAASGFITVWGFLAAASAVSFITLLLMRKRM